MPLTLLPPTPLDRLPRPSRGHSWIVATPGHALWTFCRHGEIGANDLRSAHEHLDDERALVVWRQEASALMESLFPAQLARPLGLTLAFVPVDPNQPLLASLRLPAADLHWPMHWETRLPWSDALAAARTGLAGIPPDWLDPCADSPFPLWVGGQVDPTTHCVLQREATRRAAADDAARSLAARAWARILLLGPGGADPTAIRLEPLDDPATARLIPDRRAVDPELARAALADLLAALTAHPHPNGPTGQV